MTRVDVNPTHQSFLCLSHHRDVSTGDWFRHRWLILFFFFSFSKCWKIP